MAKAIHSMIRVLDEARSVAFYDQAFGLKVAERLDFETFTLIYLSNAETGFELELTVNKGRTEPYALGDGYGHLAVSVTDVDADGKADVVLAQNFFGPQVETGRFAGGLGVILRGDGAGGLSEVWPRESGLEVSGDAKALTLADFNTDGWPDLLVGRNNDEPVAFVRTRQPGAGRPGAHRLVPCRDRAPAHSAGCFRVGSSRPPLRFDERGGRAGR